MLRISSSIRSWRRSESALGYAAAKGVGLVIAAERSRCRVISNSCEGKAGREGRGRELAGRAANGRPQGSSATDFRTRSVPEAPSRGPVKCSGRAGSLDSPHAKNTADDRVA